MQYNAEDAFYKRLPRGYIKKEEELFLARLSVTAFNLRKTGWILTGKYEEQVLQVELKKKKHKVFRIYTMCWGKASNLF